MGGRACSLCVLAAMLAAMLAGGGLTHAVPHGAEGAQRGTTSEVPGQLNVILDHLTSLDQRINGLTQRFDSVDQRLDALDQRVDSCMRDLTHRLDKAQTRYRSGDSQLMQDLRTVCAELPDVTDHTTSSDDNATEMNVFTVNVTSSNDTVAEINDDTENVTSPSVDAEQQTSEKPDIPFRLTRVEKTEHEDSYSVRVMYESSTRPEIFVGRYYEQLPQREEPGVAEFDVAKNRTEHGAHRLTFAVPDQIISVMLQLNGSSDSMDVPPFHFRVMEGSDLRFRPGEDVEFNLACDVEGDLPSSADEVLWYELVFRSDTEDNVLISYESAASDGTPHSIPVKLNALGTRDTRGHLRARLVLNATEENIEGVVRASYFVTFTRSGICLVDNVDHVIRVKFHLEDHVDPFPRDYIGFIHDFYDQNDTATKCEANTDFCYLSCRAMGEDLISVKIMPPDGVQTMVRDESYVIDDLGSFWAHFPNVSVQDAGVYRCTARSRWAEVTEDRRLQVLETSRIDEE